MQFIKLNPQNSLLDYVVDYANEQNGLLTVLSTTHP